jgi:Bacteriocin-protection, YdeI or OmpD-Associated
MNMPATIFLMTVPPVGVRAAFPVRRRGPAEIIGASGELPNGVWMNGLTLTHYRGFVSSARVPGGVVHKLPGDLRTALIANPTALDAWNDITPLARNEFICWVEDAKQDITRERRIRRTQEELEEGQRRPCCWPGCKHRERNGK